MRGYSVAFVLLLALLSWPSAAQDKGNIPFVDRKMAQALVDTMLKENETLKADSAKRRQLAAALTDQITALFQWVDELTPLLAEVKARSSDLATLTENVVDRTLKAQAVAALEKNRAQEKKVARRLDELNSQAAELRRQIETHSYQATVDDAKVARNTDDIVLLQATLSRTKVQADALQALLDQIDALTTKVDTSLQQSRSPGPPQ